MKIIKFLNLVLTVKILRIFPGSSVPRKNLAKSATVCVCTVSYKDDDDGKISRAAFFFCWWPNLLLRSLPSSPVFGSFPGKKATSSAQRVCVAASCLSVCVRANELEEPSLEELQHLKSESKARLASGRFARNIRKIVCEEESTPEWNYGLPRKTSIVRVSACTNAASGRERK